MDDVITLALRRGDKVLLKNGRITRTVHTVEATNERNFANETLYVVTYAEGATPGQWSGSNMVHGQHTWVVVERGPLLTAEQVFAQLTHPDMVGTTGYRAVWEAVNDALASCEEGEDALTMAIGQAESVKEEAESVLRILNEINFQHLARI